MTTYIEEAIFKAVDNASKPIAAINKAIDNLNKAQAKLNNSKDPFAATARSASLSRGQLNALEKEYERLGRAANNVGKQTNQAMRRLGVAAVREEDRARVAAERDVARVGNQTTQAMHRAVIAAIKEEEAAKVASLKRIEQTGLRTQQAMQRAESVAEKQKAAAARQAVVDQNKATRDKEAAEKVAAREARRAATEQQQANERAQAAEVRAAREQASQQRRAANAQARAEEQVARTAEREAIQAARRGATDRRKQREEDERANAPRRRGLYFSQTGANGGGSRGGGRGGNGGGGGGHGNGYHAYIPLGGHHMGGVGISGLSLPGAITLQAGANVAREVGQEVKTALVDYSNQKAMLSVEGLGKQVPEIDRMAGRVAQQVPQLNKGEVISLFREQFAVFGDVKEAMKQTPLAAERQAVLKAAVPGASADTSIQFAKAGEELLGGNLVSKDPATRENALKMYNQLQDTWLKTFIEEKGQVSANDFNQMIKKSKGALRSKYDINTPEGRAQMQDEVGVKLPVLAATINGAPLGTLLNSTSRAFNGRMTNTAKKEFEEAGLVDESKIITRDKKGNPERVAQGWLPGSEKTLFDYVMGPIHDMLGKKGILDDQPKRDFQIDKMFSNHVAAGAIKTILNDYERLAKAKENVDRAQNRGEAYKTINEQDLGTSGRNIKGSVETLGQTYLEPIIKPIAAVFNQLAEGIGKLSKAGETDPGSKLAATVSGAVLAGIGVAGKYIYDNPGQAANTAALTALTGAVSANTGAVAASTLGKGVVPTVAAVIAESAMVAGAVALVGAALFTIPLIAKRDPSLQLGGSRAQDYNAGDELPGMNEINAREARKAKKPEPNPFGSLRPKKPEPNPFGQLDAKPKKDNFGLNGPNLDANAKLEPIANAINSGASIFSQAAGALPGKGSEFGSLAGSAMSSAITSAGATAGAAMASAIAAAAANVQVTVNQKAAPNTGSPPAPE